MDIMSLELYQKRFSHFLKAPAGEAVSSPIMPGILKGISLEDRANIYKNNVHVALIDALKATYPAVLRLVGAEFFEFTARCYMQEYPPKSPILLDYGSCFPLFLKDFKPAASVPYLLDVARLEWFYIEAFHAQDATCLPGETFHATAFDPDMRVALHPSSRLMTSPYPVSKLWELNRADRPIKSGTTVGNDAEFLLIIRPDAHVEVRRLHESTYTLIKSLAVGCPLKEAFHAARTIDKNADPDTDLRALAHGGTFIDLWRTPQNGQARDSGVQSRPLMANGDPSFAAPA